MSKPRVLPALCLFRRGGGHSSTPPAAAPPQPPPPDTRRAHAALYDGTRARFHQAAFLSPDPETAAGELRWMSPLIVQQADPQQSGEAQCQRFGRLTGDAFGSTEVDTLQPTVYHAASAIDLHGREYDQSTYLWFYPPVSPGGPIRWRGFHMLLGERGYALVWEILSSEARMRAFFVSKPVEDAAQTQWGGPLPFRRFCTEPALADHPDVIVARAVGDGPQPMGPFVYLDHVGLQVTTLICRCEPSQADEFPTSLNYRLTDWAELQAVVDGAPDLPPDWLPDPAASSIDLLRLPARL